MCPGRDEVDAKKLRKGEQGYAEIIHMLGNQDVGSNFLFLQQFY